MGMVHAEIKLTNGEDLYAVKRNLIDRDEVRHMNINCLVDTGACLLGINENIQEYFQLPFMYKQRSQTADGRIMEFDVVGPVQVEFGGRQCTCNAILLEGDSEPLLGAIPMEEMDLVVLPLEEQLVVNPYPRKCSIRW